MPQIMNMPGFLSCQGSQLEISVACATLIFEIELFLLIW